MKLLDIKSLIILTCCVLSLSLNASSDNGESAGITIDEDSILNPKESYTDKLPQTNFEMEAIM